MSRTLPEPAYGDKPGSIASAISTGAVQITLDYTGRGPTRARTIINRDSIVVVLEDTLTKGERRLADNGKGEMVIEMRRCFQVVMKDDMIAMVEQLTGRSVRALMSDNHIDPDVACEVFLLEPAAED
jgi:uncharacterized protein YbcI